MLSAQDRISLWARFRLTLGASIVFGGLQVGLKVASSSTCRAVNDTSDCISRRKQPILKQQKLVCSGI